MKKTLLAVAFFVCGELSAQTVLLSQNFDNETKTNVSDYVAVPGSATVNEFTGIGVGGGDIYQNTNAKVEIVDKKLRFTKISSAAHGWTFNRGEQDFSPVPVFVRFSVDIAVIASPEARNTPASFNFGNSFSADIANVTAANTHSRILLYLSGDDKFSIVPVGYSGTPAVQTFSNGRFNWYVNNSGGVAEYIGPDGNTYTVNNGRSDAWVNNVRLMSDYTGNSTNPTTHDLKQFKFILTAAAQGTSVEFDNIEIVSLPATVPVSLTSFTGKSVGQYVQLNWQTASEQDNSHFEVLRSSDGDVFSKIGSVTGNGTSTKVINYNFTDRNPNVGDSYYSLRQVDRNGKTETFGPIVIKHESGAENFKIVVTDDNMLNMSVNISEETSGDLIISDISGRKVYSSKVSLSKGYNLIKLPANNITKGIFVGCLVTKDAVLTVKFVK